MLKPKRALKKEFRTSIVTQNVEEIASHTGNIYESLMSVSKRARQISTQLKEELNQKIAEFNTASDSLEEVFENREQIEVSKYYERLPKPSITALDELLANELIIKNPHREEKS
ncbi:DNA-directed RNA polymerase subunit omega [Hugenholtzia roseola]|uniref:DNA-directed RNA polymerase subunit omega n=1 Tax=Hugenholtzia roseola TaxID=1002 RepID=UPI00041617A1|nr:DNA-directed RNA polymerase subunit omega [Hugenholtzia roseola]